ncbi:hypothetical protein KHQ82_10385 [Mycoplasmatota bacterium]|nr:hypothetical protein KHQ82_10385 [Mycoplasmatota bacterium]
MAIIKNLKNISKVFNKNKNGFSRFIKSEGAMGIKREHLKLDLDQAKLYLNNHLNGLL